MHNLPDVALLFSGGLDSAILLGELVRQGCRVQPLFVRCGLAWEERELSACLAFLRALESPHSIAPLLVLDVPVAELYENHWSITGDGVPGEKTPDEAVYLPGRNALLIVKAAVWCALHSVQRLALAPLAHNPFPDATDEFFATLQSALNLGLATRLAIERPFARLTKKQVMELGRDLPLSLTFSCIRPTGNLHCGVCNKCAERQRAFADAGMEDGTECGSAGVRECGSAGVREYARE